MKRKRIIRAWSFVAIGLVIAAMSVVGYCSVQSSHRGDSSTDRSRQTQILWQKAQDRLQSMSVEEQIGQMVMPIWYPRYDKASVAAYERVLGEIHAGGILFRRGDAYDQYRLTRRLQEVSEIPLMITADAEWGLAMRLEHTIRYPRMMALAHQCDEAKMRQLGRDMAEQCRTMGIHVSFAPVLDVNNNPKNPVIGTRSLGKDPELVARLGIALAQGLESHGVLAVAKHFPGHGNTDKDSHKTLPTVNGSRDELDSIELLPFRRYIEAGLGGIMVAHLSVPALEPLRGLPTSLSPRVVFGLLRRDLGFEGLVFTDGLEMKGVQQSTGLPVSVAAILAGNDILLGPVDPVQCYRELCQAYRSGVLSEEIIRDRCLRILYYKEYLDLDTSRQEFDEQEDLTRGELYDRLYSDELVKRAEQLWIGAFAPLGSASCRAKIVDLSKEQSEVVVLEINAGNKQRGETADMLRQISAKNIFNYNIDCSRSDAAGRIETIARKHGREAIYMVQVNDTQTLSVQHAIERLSRQHKVLLSCYLSPYQLGGWDRVAEHCLSAAIAFEPVAEAKRASVHHYFSRGDTPLPQIILRPGGSE